MVQSLTLLVYYGILTYTVGYGVFISEVTDLFERSDVMHVRNDIQKIIGSKVRLETNKGRHKSVVNSGIVTNVYPSIFTIELSEGTNPSRKMSFSYTDVLTNTVEITLCE